MTKAVPLPLLQRAQIASPCHVRWEDMDGDGRVRHCAQCDLKVHNLAGLTEAEAEALLRASFDPDGGRGARFCAMIYRRPDGTIITADCPVGLGALRVRTRRAGARIAGALGLSGLAATLAAGAAGNGEPVKAWEPLALVARLVGRPAVQYRGVAGSIFIAPSPPAGPGAGGVQEER